MKKIACILITVFSSYLAISQKIVNIIFVGPGGITENMKDANAFIAIKKMDNGSFQRLNYKLSAPLQSVQTYNDSTLSVLEGNYYSYSNAGLLKISGFYKNNKKAKEWNYYNDTFKVIKKEVYEEGLLVKTIDPDTVKKEVPIDTVKKIEIEAEFTGGQKAWVKYLVNNLNADLGAKSVDGGKVIVAFVVNKEGKVADVSLRKSVEFILDEEAIRVINKSPDWKPAVQNGRKVNAYRQQPISFIK